MTCSGHGGDAAGPGSVVTSSADPPVHPDDRGARQRSLEAVSMAAAGGVLAGLVGAPLGMGRTLAAVGALNGAISGWRGIYRWRQRRGRTAFVLDSTWGLTTTAGALVSHAVAGVAEVRGRAGYDHSLSHRHDRHVYAGGFRPRTGFVITVGNVISGAGDTGRARRRQLVHVHEDLHVWQARWLGPLYPVAYAGWMAGGAVAGVAVWALRRRDEPLFRVVETCAYYLNPFEWWAYSRDGNWPPSAVVPDLAWRRPLVRAFAGSRAAPR